MPDDEDVFVFICYLTVIVTIGTFLLVYFF